MNKQDITEALKEAFKLPAGDLNRTYLDNLGAYHLAALEVLFEDYGKGSDSLLSYAESLRLN